MSPRTLEVPLDSASVARLAAPYASRIEVCADLSSEGWSPGDDLLRACRDAVEGTGCTVVAMVRPEFPGCRRELDLAAFTTNRDLLERCLRDIERSAAAGAHSVAMALLTPDGHVDMEANARLVGHAKALGLVPAFLRAFDLVADRRRSIRDLVALGYARVVTAGVRGWDASVAPLEARIETVRQDVMSAAGRIEVVPGGGVRAANARAWLDVSPHLHASCRVGGVFDPGELSALGSVME